MTCDTEGGVEVVSICNGTWPFSAGPALGWMILCPESEQAGIGHQNTELFYGV